VRASDRSHALLPASLDWLATLAEAGSTKPLATSLEKIATDLLREAGLPCTHEALSASEGNGDGLFPYGGTVGQRIVADARLPAAIRLQPQILAAVADLRRQVARHDADAAAGAGAQLVLLAAKAAALEPAHYQAPVRARRDQRDEDRGRSRVMHIAERRRRICLEIFRAERVRSHDLTFTALCERVASLARARDPSLFHPTWSGRSVRRALERPRKG
jgi:hypothetical protein